MGNDAAQADAEHRQRLVQAERVSQVLRDFEQRLHFLPSRGDGVQEIDRLLGFGRHEAALALSNPTAGAAPNSTFTSVDSLVCLDSGVPLAIRSNST